MKLLPILAFAVSLSMASLAGAMTFQFRIADTPANSFTYSSGLSGHVVSAGIEGTFSITSPPIGAPTLSSLDLFLVNVSENFEVPSFDIADLEGSPIQNFMSHDLKGSASYGFTHGWAIQFAAPIPPTTPDVILTDPHSLMIVDWTDSMIVSLFSRLTPVGTLDGPTVTFLPLTATAVPEPASLGVAMVAVGGVAAFARRRK